MDYKVLFNDKTELTFMIGDPVNHTVAGFLHNAMYDLAAVDAVCIQTRVKKEDMGKFIDAALLLNSTGFDITTPLKEHVIPFLDEVDPISEAFNSVNHVKIESGKLIGRGLDGEGMALSIEQRKRIRGSHILILGAGAVSGPVAAALCQRGVGKISITNRTLDKAQNIKRKINAMFETEIEVVTSDDLNALAPSIDIVVQTTSIGFPGNPGMHENLEFIHHLSPETLAAEVLYPSSPFLEEAKQAGLRYVNGMDMLLNQMLLLIDFRFSKKLHPDVLIKARDALVAAVAIRDSHREYIWVLQERKGR